MSVVIESITISSILEKRLVLGNASWAGTLSIGSTWTRLRMGFRWAMDDNGSNIIGTPIAFFGLLSNPAVGLTNGFQQVTTSHFRGKVRNAATMSRGTTPIVNYSGTFQDILRVGNTNTQDNSETNFISADPSNVRTAVIVEFDKTSGTAMTCQFVRVSGTAGLVDVSLAALKAAIEVDTMTNAAASLSNSIGGSGTRYGAAGVISKTIDESANGSFNALHIGWGLTSGLHHISEVLFARME